MILIKLGGSVITDKSSYRTFNGRQVFRLCEEIKASGKDVMIVHGAGSFGHVVAKEFNLRDGHVSDGQIPGVVKVSHDMRDLNRMVMDELIDAGLNVISIPTGACFELEDGEMIGSNDVLKGYVELGMIPVMFGDIVLDRMKGFNICSGDKIMEYLASVFSPEMIVFVADVDGLYDKDPKRNKDAVLIETLTDDSLSTADTGITVADVTGGVRAKMEAMLRMSSPGRDCVFVNGAVKGRLLSLLTGKDVVCTRIKRGT